MKKTFVVCLLLETDSQKKSNVCHSGRDTGESRASGYVCLIGQYNRVDDISGFPTANQKISFRFVYQGFFVSTTTRFPL